MFKNFLQINIMIFLLVGCGDEIVDVVEVPVVETVEVPVAQDFENVYFFDNSGFIEFVQSSDNEVTILREGFNLIIQNLLNETFANFPFFGQENLEVKDGIIKVARDINYRTSSRYDLEEDVSGDNITGRKFTTIKIEKLEGAKIRLDIKIYDNPKSNNLNFVIFERVIESL